MTKIQGALGKNAKLANPGLLFASSTYAEVGQVIVDSMNEYLNINLGHDDGSALVTSIYSQNLRDSAAFSARSARISYLLGKATLLGIDDRRGVVRSQIIEYGAVAEAILLDLVQSVGVNDKPGASRPTTDLKGTAIDWANAGLFSMRAPPSKKLKFKFDFNWLISQAARLNAIDGNLEVRLHWLRESRNLVHPVIPTAQRYKDDVDSSRKARNIVIATRDACLSYKTLHALP
ncbi:hypothetical protein ACLIJR_16560 [Hydrogenophaga sp. XSHU_21]|jgi:hypothetical protein